ncbi:hypothetical protein BDN72DRAFT_405940 [Pluteus cervinus]|uniref:Uncharacterized protein n=1 Tax=Pluteus cervinus TaxID=181527 RepID=A0ACD3A8W9_9AGAR|nr:hypothetical protein BDN72DRAFT_405940 [Pluteus cervinus]
MSLRDLPQDVLDEITRSLKAIHEKSLPSLSLVSLSLRSPTQRQIFRCITLSNDLQNTISPISNPFSPPPHHIRLRNILTENPTLATYIQDIQCLQFENGGVGRMELEAKHWMIYHGILLAKILRLLEDSPLKRFTIVNAPGPGSLQMNWLSLHKTLQQTLVHHIFNKETLSFVHFSGLLLPQNIFSAFVNLKDVCLGNIFWSPRDKHLLTAEEAKPDSTVQHSSPQIRGNSDLPLQSLSSLRFAISEVRHGSLELLGPKMGLDLTGLQTLQLDLVIAVPMSSITRFLLSPNLKDLIIRIPPTELDPNTNVLSTPTSINLNPVLKLRTLTLLHNPLSLSLNELSWIDPTLSSLNPTLPLQLVAIRLTLWTDHFDTDFTPFTPFTSLSQTLSCLHQVFRRTIELIIVHIQVVHPSLGQASGQVEILEKVMKEHIVWDGCSEVLVLDVAAECQ